MRFKLYAVLLVMGLSGAAQAVPITYDINLSVGAGSVMGTITTDGTIGNLSAANVTGWNFTVNDGVDDLLFDGDESFEINTTFAEIFTATTTGLFFDYDGGLGNIKFRAEVGQVVWEFIIQADTPFGGASIIHQGMATFHIQVVDNLAGVQQIAAAPGPITEPALLTLLPLGLGVMTLARRRKRR